MGRYILKRLLLILPTLFLILLANFVIVQAAPGGPVEQQLALIEQSAKDGALSGNIGAGSAGGNKSTYQGTRGLSEEMVAAINAQYGFDKSAPERFWLMLRNYAKLDFGTSFFKGQSVTDLIVEKLPVSISLGLWSTLLIYMIAIPLGVYKAMHHGSGIDKATAMLLAIGHAIPVFVFAVILLVFLPVAAIGIFFRYKD